MKLIYITNTRFPSEKANSYQSMQMCYSFSEYFNEVELWTGRARNTNELNAIKNIFEYYNVKKTFVIRKFFQFDSKILFIFNEFIWANLKNLIFSVNVCFRLIQHKNSNNTFIYCRDWSFIFIFLNTIKCQKNIDNGNSPTNPFDKNAKLRNVPAKKIFF